MIEKLSFHQAWQLEKLCTENLNYSVHFLSDLLENFDKIENHSARRSLCKIIALTLKKQKQTFKRNFRNNRQLQQRKNNRNLLCLSS